MIGEVHWTTFAVQFVALSALGFWLYRSGHADGRKHQRELMRRLYGPHTGGSSQVLPFVPAEGDPAGVGRHDPGGVCPDWDAAPKRLRRAELPAARTGELVSADES